LKNRKHFQKVSEFSGNMLQRYKKYMNNANIFQDFFVLSEKWCEMVRKIRQQLSTIGNNYFGWSTIINHYQQFARGDAVND